MSGMRQYTYQIVVFPNQNRRHDVESMQEMFKSSAVQSGSGNCITQRSLFNRTGSVGVPDRIGIQQNAFIIEGVSLSEKEVGR